MDNMIGQRIKERRNQLNITGKQIKEATGISTGNLSEIENGKILPSATALMELSKALECSCDYILFGESRISESPLRSNIRDSERQFIEQFRCLSDNDKEDILMMLKLKYNRIKKTNQTAQTLSITKSDKTLNEFA